MQRMSWLMGSGNDGASNGIGNSVRLVKRRARTICITSFQVLVANDRILPSNVRFTIVQKHRTRSYGDT